MRFTSLFFLLTLLFLGSSSSIVEARASVPTRAERARAACLDSITGRIRSARVGTPPKAIPANLHRAAAIAVYDAIGDGLTEREASRRFYNRLRVIRNIYWRNDLASAAATIVGNPPNACE